MDPSWTWTRSSIEFKTIQEFSGKNTFNNQRSIDIISVSLSLLIQSTVLFSHFISSHEVFLLAMFPQKLIAGLYFRQLHIQWASLDSVSSFMDISLHETFVFTIAFCFYRRLLLDYILGSFIFQWALVESASSFMDSSMHETIVSTIAFTGECKTVQLS